MEGFIRRRSNLSFRPSDQFLSRLSADARPLFMIGAILVYDPSRGFLARRVKPWAAAIAVAIELV
jgi:hypothetical protein